MFWLDDNMRDWGKGVKEMNKGYNGLISSFQSDDNINNTVFMLGGMKFFLKIE